MMATWSAVNKSELESKLRIDAEYYQPTFLQLAKFLEAQRQTQPLRTLLSRPIHRGTLPQYDESGEVYVIKTRNVRNDFLVFHAPEFTTEEFYKANPRGRVDQHDVLMTSTGRGTLGRCNVFSESFKAYADGHIALIRPDHQLLDPFYLYIYLVSKFGQLQIERAYTGSTGQIEIYPAHISSLLVFTPPRQFQTKVRMAVVKAHELKRKSEDLYLKAEGMVLDDIGWDKLDLSQPKWRTVPVSRAREVHRLDAEHFQPKYDQLIARLNKTGRAKPLGEIAAYIKRGLQPEYVEDGEVLVFTEKHLARYLLNVDAAGRTSLDFWKDNPKARVQKSDIIMYSIGAYIGRANIYLGDDKAITSSNATVIRPDANKIVPGYLAVYLNSTVGNLQAEQWTASVGQMALYPNDIAKFIVRLPSERFQENVADLVQRSYHARRKAKALLEEAKAKVEALIERASS